VQTLAPYNWHTHTRTYPESVNLKPDLGYPAPPRDPKPLADQEASGILGPIRIRAPDRSELTFFGMFATFDTPFDVTTSELAIELLFPANQAIARGAQEPSPRPSGNLSATLKSCRASDGAGARALRVWALRRSTCSPSTRSQSCPRRVQFVRSAAIDPVGRLPFTHQAVTAVSLLHLDRLGREPRPWESAVFTLVMAGRQRKRLLDPTRCRVGVAVAAVLHVHAHTNNAPWYRGGPSRLSNPTVQFSTGGLKCPS
jgi:hypothetical protein